MSEVELLYKNAHIEKVINHECTYDYGITCPNDDDTCENCGYYKEKEPDYPPFTAEKQLELIKWLARKGLIQINYSSHQCYQFNSFRVGGDYKTDIGGALASHYNNLWQDLTEQERTEVAEILKG